MNTFTGEVLPVTGPAKHRTTRRSVKAGTVNVNEDSLTGSNENLCEASEYFPPKSTSAHSLPKPTFEQEYLKYQETLGESAMNHLCTLGLAYKEICLFNCEEALEILNSLPIHHFETGWCLSLAGRAYFEMVKYSEAENVFSTMRRLEPFHIEGCEYYSTVLWHLRKEKELSFLAHELVRFDRTCPQAWCVVGNCFSLQKEHESALKFFERAIQVCPDFTYAYTLLGHEYVYNEDFEKALSCYRNSIRTDERHYNAWYGLGMIYYRQEKYELAEYHFRKALSINPRSTVLYCYIGMVLHARKRSQEALLFLDKALMLNACNPLVKFNKAIVLFSLDRCPQALEELEELQTIALRNLLFCF